MGGERKRREVILEVFDKWAPTIQLIAATHTQATLSPPTQSFWLPFEGYRNAASVVIISVHTQHGESGQEAPPQ